MAYLSEKDGLWIVDCSLQNHLKTLIRRHNVIDLLKGIALLTALRSGGSDQEKELDRIAKAAGADSLRTFRPFQLALLAKIALEENSHPKYPRIVHTEDLLSYCKVLMQIMGDVEETIAGIESLGFKTDATSEILFRIANLQFPDSDNLLDHLPRALILYKRLPQQKSYGFNPADAFTNISNGTLSLDEFWFIGLGIFSLALTHPGKPISVKQITESREVRGLDNEKVQAFLGLNGIKPEDFGKLTPSREANWDGYQIYDYNQLVERPIVILSNERFIVPVPRLLIERISSGLYYIFIKEYNQSFASPMGMIFQDYVDFLLRDSVQDRQIISESEYSQAMHGRPLPDFLVLDGNSLLLVDVAMARISAKTKAMADREQLKQELQREDHVIDHLSKLHQVERDIPAFALTCSPLANVVRVVSLLVLMDRFYWANDFFTRQIINELLELRGIDPGRFSFQITHAPEFEHLISLSYKQSLVDLVMEKAQHAEARFWQFKQFNLKKSKEFGVDLECQSLRKVFDEEYDALKKKFGNK